MHSDAGSEPQASLYQRPGNRLHKPIYSNNVQTHNLVLKITVPKRVCNKRKRTPLQGKRPNAGEKTSQLGADATNNLLRAMNDCRGRFHVEIVGVTEQTHRYRTLPDFVSSSTQSPFMRKMQETILPFEYDKMKKFKIDNSKGVKPKLDVIPPPSWSQFDIPFNYAYRQNPGTLTTVDSRGQLSTWNTQLRPKTRSQVVSFDSSFVPTEPSAGLLPLSSTEPAMQRLVAAAREVLRKRPIVTRRSLPNLIPENEWQGIGQHIIKAMFQYVGYVFGSGPWRDCIVRFGIDPRTDPSYRVYQTFMFVLENQPLRSKSGRLSERKVTGKPDSELNRESHIFNGVQLGRDGKVWQVCDITDPVLQEILATNELREVCHVESDGWFHSGTCAKAKMIMKSKITAILSGEPSAMNVRYGVIACTLPDKADTTDTLAAASLISDASPKERELITAIRSQYRRDKDGKDAAVNFTIGDQERRKSDNKIINSNDDGADDDDDGMLTALERG